MARHSYEKARWNRQEARKRTPSNGWNRWHQGCFIWTSADEGMIWLWEVQRQQRKLSRSVHAGLGNYTRRYRRLWRRRSHQQERLHRLELHDEAQELDPQPRRLGVMRDIW